MNRIAKRLRNSIIAGIALLALGSLTLTSRTGVSASSDSNIPTYTGSDAMRGSLNISGYWQNDSTLGASGAMLQNKQLISGSSIWWTPNASYYGGAIQTSDGNITTSNMQSIAQTINLTIDGYSLTKYVASPFYANINGTLTKYAGYLETTSGQTVPNELMAISADILSGMSVNNAGNLITPFPEFGSNAPKGDGQQSSGAMADFSVNMQQSIQGATNWISLSNFDSNVDSMNFGLNGHTMTLTGKTTISNVDASYSVTLDVETVKASSIGDTSCSDPSALDFHVTTTSATVNGVSVNPSLVLNALYAITKQHNSFVTYSGGNDFYMSVYEMPGGSDLNAGDSYGTTTWKTNRILVGVNWSTGTFYYDYTDGSGQRNVPMDLGD